MRFFIYSTAIVIRQLRQKDLYKRFYMRIDFNHINVKKEQHIKNLYLFIDSMIYPTVNNAP